MFWQITDEDLDRARSGDGSAIERVYAQALEPCARIATSIAGQADIAQKVLCELVRRSVKQLEHWEYADAASAWFMHHTILLLREYRTPVTPDRDILLHDIGGPDVMQYRAMINAIRKLSDQQQEAFILTHAQRWNTRLCAVAMDCSNTAVETHLAEANRQVQPLLGKDFAALVGFLEQVHRSLPINLPAAPRTIATRIKARRGARLLTHVFGWLLIGLIIAIIIAFAIIVGPRIET